MTRSYATLDCGIWDPESGFAALSAGAQRTYFMLVSQSSIAACGTLALTTRRWAKTCAEGDDIKAWLDELTEARYVLIDEDTEELLVRTFVKWDGGYKHPQRLKAVIATAKAIQSRPIRTAMAEEMLKIGLSSPYQVAPGSPRTPEPNPETSPPTPQPSLQEGEPPAENGPPSPFCSKHPNGTEKPCGACGTAKMRLARWEKTHRERDARAAKARADCPLCDEHGIRLDPDTRRPSGRCDHLPLGAVS